MIEHEEQLFATDYGNLLATFSYLVAVKNNTLKLHQDECKGAIAPERNAYLTDLINGYQQRINGMYHYLVHQYPYISTDHVKALADAGVPIGTRYEPVAHSKEFLCLPMKSLLSYYMESDNYDVVKILTKVEAVMDYDTLHLFLHGNTDADIEFSLKTLGRQVSYAIHPALNVMKMFKPST